MKIGRFALLATLALAVAAFAVPAAASASEFRHSGQPIAEGGETETFEGWFEASNRVRCGNVVADVTFEAQEASIGSFLMQECETVGTLAGAGCELTGTTVESINTPWLVKIDSGDKNLSVRGASFKLLIAPGCGIPGYGGGGILNLNGSESLGSKLAGEEIEEGIFSAANLSIGGYVDNYFGTVPTTGELLAANSGSPFEFEL